ncbi:MAG: hypothetical protein J6A01_06150, partial [Proteobacteria bacterium]|nr:hypothetical protein [Pseudomonadota bacterium]
MSTKHIICIVFTGAYIIGGCSEKTLSAGCDEHAAPQCIDNALYQCASSADGTYWKKLDCDFGCFKDANNNGKCYECDPNDREKKNKCDYSKETKTSSIFECNAIPGSESNKGIWELKQACLNGCTGNIGSSIYESTCKCVADCVNGCNDDGSCKTVDKCTKHDITGSCASCKNGVNPNDGTCIYPDCVLGEEGKLDDGECNAVIGCKDSHDETGACICAEDVNHVLDGELIGTCECSDNCVAECNADGTCKLRSDCNSVDSNTGACICAEGINNIISNDENNGKCECHDTCKGNCNPDGSCKCENCATTCIFPSSVCQTARACVTDTDCFNYDYCKTAPCFCSNVDNQNGWEKNKCYLKDSNHNNMDDRYEDLALNRQDCSTNPNKSMVCTDGFCDSFIGYKCSTKCTDVTASNNVPVCLDGFTCRETDGRCAADSFTTVWSSEIRNNGIIFYGKPVSDISICWDWDDVKETCAETEIIEANNNIIEIVHKSDSQSSKNDSNVIIKITGKLDNFFIYHDLNKSKDEAQSISNTLLEVRSFGQVGLGVPSKNLNCNRG